MADKVLDIITAALFEMQAYGPGDPVPSAADAQLGLRLLNEEIDAATALKRYSWTETFALYTLEPNHSPHLIGPGLAAPDFAIAQRPVRLEGAALVLNNVNPEVDAPILNIRDAAWWRNQAVKGLTTAIPTDVYYEPDWPDGSLYFWPIPTVAYQVRLQLWVTLVQFAAITSAFSTPPAYKRWITLKLAKRLCRPFGKAITKDLIDDLREATAALQSNNIKSPRIASADYGASGDSHGRGSTFNYYDGLPGNGR